MQTWHAKLKRNAELTKRSIQIQKVESDEVESSGPQIKRMKPTIDYAEDSEQVRQAVIKFGLQEKTVSLLAKVVILV